MARAGEGTRQEGAWLSGGGTTDRCTHDGNRDLYSLLVEPTHDGNKYGSFLKKARQAKSRTTYDPAIWLLADPRKDAASYFRNQLGCSSTDEWKIKM